MPDDKTAVSSESHRQFNEWMMMATRYVVLANAGGAIGTLGFIGTSMSQYGVLKPAVAPLFLFVSGIVIGSLAILGQLTGTWMAYTGPIDHTRKRLATRLGAWAEKRTGRILLAAFTCFAAGALVGMVVLLMA